MCFGGCYWWVVNIRSGNGLVPDEILNQICDVIGHNHVFDMIGHNQIYDVIGHN